MIAGCSTSAAAFLTQVLPSQDDGTHFLVWFWDWFERYLTEKGVSFEQIRETKAARLAVTTARDEGRYPIKGEFPASEVNAEVDLADTASHHQALV
jgi:hypothetical protein